MNTNFKKVFMAFICFTLIFSTPLTSLAATQELTNNSQQEEKYIDFITNCFNHLDTLQVYNKDTNEDITQYFITENQKYYEVGDYNKIREYNKNNHAVCSYSIVKNPSYNSYEKSAHINAIYE
jgi:hypothetical protein